MGWFKSKLTQREEEIRESGTVSNSSRSFGREMALKYKQEEENIYNRLSMRYHKIKSMADIEYRKGNLSNIMAHKDELVKISKKMNALKRDKDGIEGSIEGLLGLTKLSEIDPEIVDLLKAFDFFNGASGEMGSLIQQVTGRSIALAEAHGGRHFEVDYRFDNGTYTVHVDLMVMKNSKLLFGRKFKPLNLMDITNDDVAKDCVERVLREMGNILVRNYQQ